VAPEDAQALAELELPEYRAGDGDYDGLAPKRTRR
jgi:hypothetical protein